MADTVVEPRLNVGVIEGEERSRDFLVYLLQATRGIRVVGDWRNVEALLANGPVSAPDVLLLDIQLPGMSGIDGLAPLLQRFPRTKTLILTVLEDEKKVLEALRRGADGYLLKNMEPASLVNYIQEAGAGGSPMSPEISRKVVRLLRRVAPARAEHNLSPREVRSLALLAEGHSYGSIAVEMDVSINTVRTYIRNVYQKLHVSSRSAAVAEALRSGIIR